MKVIIHKKDSDISKALFAKLNSRLGYTIDGFDEIVEFNDNGKPVGIVTINICPYEVYLDIYAPGFQLTRSAIATFFEHAFAHRPRLTCIVSSRNTHCRQFLLRLGFQLEGRKRCAFDGINDELYFGMLYEDWINTRWAKYI